MQTIRKMVAVVAALIPVAAAAQAAAAVQPEQFTQPTWDEFLTRGGLSIGLVIVLVRVLREAFPTQLAPSPSTLMSKRLIILSCLVMGACFGLVGLAPQVVAGIGGKLIGGVAVGAIAFGVAAVLPEKVRLDHLGKVGEMSLGKEPPAPPTNQ